MIAAFFAFLKHSLGLSFFYVVDHVAIQIELTNERVDLLERDEWRGFALKVTADEAVVDDVCFKRDGTRIIE